MRLASLPRRLVQLMLGWLACAPLAMAAPPPLPVDLAAAAEASTELKTVNFVVENVGSYPEACARTSGPSALLASAL